jgi:hypothetical protein
VHARANWFAVPDAEHALIAVYGSAIVSQTPRLSEAASDYAKAKGRRKDPILERWHSYQASYDRLNDWLPPSLQRVLRDRSLVLGATQPGDFFQHTPEQIEALRRGTKRKKPRT